MNIVIASDHAGFALKQSVRAALEGRDARVEDLGTDSAEPVDYPAIAAELAEKVGSGAFERGVLIGGTGQGEAVVANRFAGVRAAICTNEYVVRVARAHLDANVLVLGARVTAEAHGLALLDLFLGTPFEAGRHQPRLDQIALLGP